MRLRENITQKMLTLQRRINVFKYLVPTRHSFLLFLIFFYRCVYTLRTNSDCEHSQTYQSLQK
ncbi:hypothetical protein PUN28_012396 [Cardiocondyla obscurior]|uniref:Uncharacterized protein n=1 Tax=Cardiocondyla obscurior TaxID=286306 RepID=A0AAW2FCH5_9HYME